MVNLNYLNAKTNKRQNRIERGAPLGYSSISKGALSIYSEEGLIVDGSARVSGTLLVDGTLDGEGKMKWTGPAELDGDVKVTKTLDVSAETRLRGETTLEADMNVVDGGKVVVGSVELGITSNGRPGLDFDGATLTENADRLAMETGTAVVGVAPTFAAVAFANKSIVVNGTRTTITGGLALPGYSSVPAAGRTANVWMDPATGVVSLLSGTGSAS